MRIPNSLLAAAIVCAGCSSVPQHKTAPQPSVVTVFEDAKFVRMIPEWPDSPERAVLWGDPRAGPSAMFLRVRKGLIPLHIHWSDYHALLVQGSMKHWAEYETEHDAKVLGSGSYWFQPANEPHADNCLSDECVGFLVWSGKQGGMFVEPRKK